MHLVLVVHEQLAPVAVVANDPAILQPYKVKSHCKSVHFSDAE